MVRFFAQLIAAFWEELRRYLETNFVIQDPKVRLRSQLRAMYGRGEISRERFFEMLRRLDWDQIGQGDVTLLHREAMMRLQAQGKLNPGYAVPEIESCLDRLYQDTGMLLELRLDVAEKLAGLKQEASWLREQVELARKGAQSALPNEAEARAYLEVWQSLVELSERAENRLKLLDEANRRIDLLEAELKASTTELTLLESRQRLAELNLRIRQDLLIQGEKLPSSALPHGRQSTT